jgi:3-hydroxyisobutyrate dehydrogenase
VAEDPAKAINAGEVIFLTLADFPSTLSVLSEARTRLPSAATKCFVQMATISPDQSLALAQWVQDWGGVYIEAPVLGSAPEALSGKLLVFGGGAPERWAELQPVLNELAGSTFFVGPLGKAAALKLAVNQLIATLTAAFALSLAFIQREGISVDLFMEILRKSALYAPTFDKKLPRMLAHDYSNPNFTCRLLLKDLRLIRKELEKRGIAGGWLGELEKVLEEAEPLGWMDLDYSVLYELISGNRRL